MCPRSAVPAFFMSNGIKVIELGDLKIMGVGLTVLIDSVRYDPACQFLKRARVGRKGGSISQRAYTHRTFFHSMASVRLMVRSEN